MLNCFKLLLFFHINLHCTHHNEKSKKWIYHNFANVLKRKHWKKWHCTSLHTLCFDIWNLDQEHSSFTGSSLRCFYAPTGVQLIGHDLERHTCLSIKSLTAEIDVRAKTKPWGQRNGLQSWETGLCWDRSGEDYRKKFCCVEGSQEHLASIILMDEVWNNQDSS